MFLQTVFQTKFIVHQTSHSWKNTKLFLSDNILMIISVFTLFYYEELSNFCWWMPGWRWEAVSVIAGGGDLSLMFGNGDSSGPASCLRLAALQSPRLAMAQHGPVWSSRHLNKTNQATAGSAQSFLQPESLFADQHAAAVILWQHIIYICLLNLVSEVEMWCSK